MKIRTINLLIFIWLWVTIVAAGEADVIAVDIKQTDDNHYQFDVTLRHADEGWNHYANKWEVMTLDDQGDIKSILATRVLHHPHVNEQPFTRSLDDVAIPEEVAQVTVRAHDSVHGYGGEVIEMNIPRKEVEK